MSEAEVMSPKPSSDQFDALIELLATDNVADESNFHIAPEGAPSTGLRDASGKLDYAKIRSLFEQRRAGKDIQQATSSADPTINRPDLEIKLPEVITHVSLIYRSCKSALDRCPRANGSG